MQISEYQAKMQNAIQKAQIALESAKALGQYTAQLAAGALSAVHVSAGMSASGSVSSSESKSTSTSHNYSYWTLDKVCQSVRGFDILPCLQAGEDVNAYLALAIGF